VATRSIDHHLKKNCKPGDYIYSSAVGYRPSMYKNYFKFAFVRNPVMRFVSGWKDKILRQNYFKLPEEKLDQLKDLDNFIDWIATQDVEVCDEHFRAQYALIDLNHLDFLGRFENFDRDFEFVARKLNFAFEENLKLNTTKNISADITDSQQSKIIKLYEKDVRTFYPELLDH
jgi:hypothetical protein